MSQYATPCRPANDCKVNDLEWPWAAIWRQKPFSNGYFMTKCVFGQHFLNQSVWISEIVQPLRLCGVLCIARSVSQPIGRHAQLTRCFSAVAELLVIIYTHPPRPERVFCLHELSCGDARHVTPNQFGTSQQVFRGKRLTEACVALTIKVSQSSQVMLPLINKWQSHRCYIIMILI